MAISANTVFEVRNGGSDTNGGGFVTGAAGTDWTLQTAAQYSVTDGVAAGTTTLTSATAAFGTDVVGNLIYVQGGTGSITAGWYQIISRTNATTIVVDRSTGLTAGTGVTLKIGGAFASPGIAGGLALAGNIVYIKYNASPFSITSASTNVAAGCISNATNTRWIGYDSTRTVINTDTNRPTLQLNVSTATMWALSGGGFVSQIILDGNAQTASKAIAAGNFFKCTIKNFNTATSGSCNFIACDATLNSAAVFLGLCYYCEAYTNTATPFNSNSTIYAFCLSYNNTGATTDGFIIGNNTSSTMLNCVAYNNGRDGFSYVSTLPVVSLNCISSSNGRYGFIVPASNLRNLINCATYNNTSGAINGTPTFDFGSIVLSADPFVSVGGTNFALNSTSGGGAALRGLGFPASFPTGATADYADIGATQSQASSGSGGSLIGDGLVATI